MVATARKDLIISIERAFDKVTLFDGVGIYEADAIDDYASEEVRKREREKDIRDDWKSIPDGLIDQYFSVLSFMDDKGLRFSIPAYMRFVVIYFDTLASPSVNAIIYLLAKQRDWRFLSEEQKDVVAKFLCYLVIEADDFIDVWQASLAYENIWSKYDK